MKPIKRSVAYVIYNNDRKKFLIVQRPYDDESLPGIWGLPAGSLKENETFEEAVLRSGKEKLGIEVKIIRFIGEDQIEREKFILHMKEYEVDITNGVPEVPQKVPRITQYIKFKWGTKKDITKAALKGSLCSRIYLSKIDYYGYK